MSMRDYQVLVGMIKDIKPEAKRAFEDGEEACIRAVIQRMDQIAEHICLIAAKCEDSLKKIEQIRKEIRRGPAKYDVENLPPDDL